MKAIDCILPPATSAFEEWARWMNWMETQLRTRHYSHKKVIEVHYDG